MHPSVKRHAEYEKDREAENGLKKTTESKSDKMRERKKETEKARVYRDMKRERWRD